MTAAPHAFDVDQFRRFVSRRFGLHLDDAKRALIGDVLRRRLDASGGTCASLLAHLETDGGVRDLEAVIAEVTVPETYFFRNIEQFRAFREVVLPDRMRARGDAKCLRVLSLGCASGEEPYSLAIVVHEAALDPSWSVSIVGVDLNPLVLAKAVRGRFSPWALREAPEDVKRRWFRAEGAELVLDDKIRRAVTFEEHNLADFARDPWPGGTYDVVFWRNVMMYFTPECARAVVARVTRALAPGGYLFLGHAETLRGVSNEFHLCQTHGTFYYRRLGGPDLRTFSEWRSESASPAESVLDGALEAPLAVLFEGADSWVDTIHRASQRIAVLTDPSKRAAAAADSASTGRRASSGSAVSAASAPAWNLVRALELLDEERFAESLELVRALPPESALDPHVLLLRAVLLTHGGQLEEAEDVCAELLAIDELDAGAHYLLALCREGAGDRRGAIDHDLVSVSLDPSFAMPRLHLGLLSRRANDRQAARRDLGHALVLLQREDTSRLKLFGGGFGRDALVALCRAEIVASGGSP